MIVRRGDKWALMTRDGKKMLGLHATQAEAEAQERAIEASKRRDSEGRPPCSCRHASSGLREIRVLGATDGSYVVNEETTEIRVPVVALVEGVIFPVNADQPELVTAEELARDPKTWDGVPVLIDHPVNDRGARISATEEGVGERYAIGKIANPRISHRKLLMDAVLYPARAEALGAGRLLERVRAGEHLEVSVGAFVETDDKPGAFRGKRFGAKWLNIRGDHLAILPEGVTGACSVKMGCGLNRAASARAHLVTACGDMYAMPMMDAAPTGSDGWLRGKLEEKLRATVPAYGGVVAVFSGEKRVVYSASPDGKSEQYQQKFKLGDNGEPELTGPVKEVYSVTTFSTAARRTWDKVRARALGDKPGHEFHGNQWTSGSGGSAPKGGWNGEGIPEEGHLVSVFDEGSGEDVNAVVTKVTEDPKRGIRVTVDPKDEDGPFTVHVSEVGSPVTVADKAERKKLDSELKTKVREYNRAQDRLYAKNRGNFGDLKNRKTEKLSREIDELETKLGLTKGAAYSRY